LKHSAKYGKCWIFFTLLVALVLISNQETILDPLESDLATHMLVEHALYVTIGALSILVVENFLKIIVVYENSRKKGNEAISTHGLTSVSFVTKNWAQLIRWIFKLNRYGFFWISIAIGLVVVWHIPVLFNIATENQDIHILQHISFIAVGATSLLAIRSLGENSKIFLLFSMAGMMAFSGLVFVVSTERTYIFYSLDSHIQAGADMIISSIVLLLVGFPAYIIKRSLFFIRS
jgi:hypothetical protein